MNKQFPTPEQVRDLPVQLEMEVPADWEDRNGHVNVQYYLKLYELGGWAVLENDDFDDDWFTQQGVGMFDLEHHLSFRAELMVGDRVATFNRILGRSDKRFHGMYLILDETQKQLAAIVEYVTACVDMSSRRMTQLPVPLARHLDYLSEIHGQMEWPAPLCGAIRP